jgi:hypothetical protein
MAKNKDYFYAINNLFQNTRIRDFFFLEIGRCRKNHSLRKFQKCLNEHVILEGDISNFCKTHLNFHLLSMKSIFKDGERQNRELDKLIDAAAKIKYAGIQFLSYIIF